jgi:hypothetical protein
MRDRAAFAGALAGILLLLVAWLAPPASAAVIMFNGISTGVKPNGFVSPEDTRVSFSDSIGANLDLEDYGVQSHGPALGCFGDDPSTLLMNFTQPMTTLSLEFGNDDPGFTVAGDVAVLRAFLNSTQVAESTVVLNRDDIMNQSISVTGVFNNAVFFYGRGVTPTPINLIEIVDNVNAVPEPVALTSLSAACVCLLLRRQRH